MQNEILKKDVEAWFERYANFLSRVFTVNKTWVNFYDQEQSSNRWNEDALVLQSLRNFVLKNLLEKFLLQ